MLESMTYNPRPTRAEVSDVGNAVLDGADCVMLSGETAKGSYPLESVRLMAETVLLAEQTIFYPNLFNEIRVLTPRPTGTTETVCCAAVSASLEEDAKAIIVVTTRYIIHTRIFNLSLVAILRVCVPSIDLVCQLLRLQGVSIQVAIVICIVEFIPFCIPSLVLPMLNFGKKMLMPVFIGL
jgi:pyruvate kinase